jgi:hypothetical protein
VLAFASTTTKVNQTLAGKRDEEIEAGLTLSPAVWIRIAGLYTGMAVQKRVSAETCKRVLR